MGQLRDGGWTHAYMTDKVFDPTSHDPALHNPWDALPTYWGDLVRAVRKYRHVRLLLLFFCRACCFVFEGLGDGQPWGE